MASRYPVPTVCDYCGAKVILTGNESIYGRPFGNGMCYKCTKCDAYVGVHTGTTIPLGRMANKELRRLKMEAHALLDPMWKSRRYTRRGAYATLAKLLDIPESECHIGWFDKGRLNAAISILRNIKQQGGVR